MAESTKAEIEAAKQELLAAIAAGATWDECEQPANRLATALLLAGTEKAVAVRELRDAGLSRSGAKQLVKKIKLQNQANEGGRQKDGVSDDAVPVCPHCLGPLGQLDHFCPNCRAPVSGLAAVDPMGQVYSYGFMCQRATSGKPRFVTFLGMWLIFGTQLPFLIILLFLEIAGYVGWDTGNFHIDYEGFVLDMIKCAVTLGLVVLYSVILWKTTARYLRNGNGEIAPQEPTQPQA